MLPAAGQSPRKFHGPSDSLFAVQWAYLFERFPSWTQTFCYREVAEMERQGMAPWIWSIRRPEGEPPQTFPAGLADRVRYLPEESELGDEFRWLKRCDRLPEPLRADEQRLKGGRDKARIQEAGWLGGPMKLAGHRPRAHPFRRNRRPDGLLATPALRHRVQLHGARERRVLSARSRSVADLGAVGRRGAVRGVGE